MRVLFFLLMEMFVMLVIHGQDSGFTFPADPKWIDVGTNSVYYFEKSTTVTWFHAARICALMGLNRSGYEGRLVTLETAGEYNLLRPYISDLQGNIWLGLSKDPKGTFVWINHRPLTFTNWEPGEPNNEYNSNEDCVELRLKSMAWNDLPCNLGRLFVCASEKEDIPLGSTAFDDDQLSTQQITSATSVVQPQDCGPMLKDWKYFHNNCYLVRGSHEDALDWMSAEQYCVDKKGHLVSVMDQREEDFILKELSKDSESMHSLWSGLKYMGNVSSSTWTDGYSTNYTKTDGKLIPDGCVAFNLLLGRWTSIDCTRNMGLICKIPYVPPSSPDVDDCCGTPKALASQAVIEPSSCGSQVAGIVVNIVISLLILSILVYLLIKRFAVNIKFSSWVQGKVNWRRKSEEDLETIQNTI